MVVVGVGTNLVEEKWPLCGTPATVTRTLLIDIDLAIARDGGCPSAPKIRILGHALTSAVLRVACSFAVPVAVRGRGQEIFAWQWRLRGEGLPIGTRVLTRRNGGVTARVEPV